MTAVSRSFISVSLCLCWSVLSFKPSMFQWSPMKPLNITYIYIYDYANLQVEEVRGSNISLKLLGHNFVRCDCLYCARRVNDWTFQSVISAVWLTWQLSPVSRILAFHRLTDSLVHVLAAAHQEPPCEAGASTSEQRWASEPRVRVSVKAEPEDRYFPKCMPWQGLQKTCMSSTSNNSKLRTNSSMSGGPVDMHFRFQTCSIQCRLAWQFVDHVSDHVLQFSLQNWIHCRLYRLLCLRLCVLFDSSRCKCKASILLIHASRWSASHEQKWAKISEDQRNWLHIHKNRHRHTQTRYCTLPYQTPAPWVTTLRITETISLAFTRQRPPFRHTCNCHLPLMRWFGTCTWSEEKIEERNEELHKPMPQTADRTGIGRSGAERCSQCINRDAIGTRTYALCISPTSSNFSRPGCERRQ